MSLERSQVAGRDEIPWPSPRERPLHFLPALRKGYFIPTQPWRNKETHVVGSDHSHDGVVAHASTRLLSIAHLLRLVHLQGSKGRHSGPSCGRLSPTHGKVDRKTHTTKADRPQEHIHGLMPHPPNPNPTHTHTPIYSPRRPIPHLHIDKGYVLTRWRGVPVPQLNHLKGAGPREGALGEGCMGRAGRVEHGARRGGPGRGAGGVGRGGVEMVWGGDATTAGRSTPHQKGVWGVTTGLSCCGHGGRRACLLYWPTNARGHTQTHTRATPPCPCRPLPHSDEVPPQPHPPG
jgi:hypothetical protein